MTFGKSPFIHENPNMMYGNILEADPVFPKDNRCSDELQDFIKKLLKKTAVERIGFDDEQEIFAHPWFNDITFSKMIEKKIPAKIIPQIDHEEVSKLLKRSSGQEKNQKDLDLSFEREEEKKPVKKPPGSETTEEFSYFEEEDYVETAMHEEELDELEEQYRETIWETGMSECSSEDDGTKRDALDSPKDYNHKNQLNIGLLRKNSLGAKEIVADKERKMSGGNEKNYHYKAAEAEDKLRNVSLKMASQEFKSKEQLKA